MTITASSDREIALFVDLAAWLTPTLQDPTWLGFVGWLEQWVDAASLEQIRFLLPLDTPEQRLAEEALALWLHGRNERRAPRRITSTRVERDVDWATSWSRSGRMPVEEFVLDTAIPGRDPELESALASLGEAWAHLLRSTAVVEGHEKRARQLEVAIASLPRAPRVPFQPPHLANLRRFGRSGVAVADILRRAMGFWSRPVVRSDEHLRLLAQALASASLGTENVNDMLELTIRMAVVRAAVESGDADRPGAAGRWVVDPVRTRPRRTANTGRDKPQIRLRLGNLRCELTKGHPKDWKGRELDDVLVPVKQAAGRGASGHEPDLVIAVWDERAAERRVVLLGDAKRNASGDGRGYLGDSIDVAAYYTFSYGHLAGVELRGRTVHSPVTPFVTLFSCQGLPEASLEPEALTARLRATDEPLPFALALDLGRHFGLAPDGSWDGTVLAAWFGRLVRLASRRLEMLATQ